MHPPRRFRSAPRSSPLALAAWVFNSRCDDLSQASTLLQSFSRRLLADAHTDASGSPEVSSPSALSAPQIRSTRGCLTRHVPPSGFDYPLGGLLPATPRPSYFVWAALLGFPFGVFLPREVTSASRLNRTHPPLHPRILEASSKVSRKHSASGLLPSRGPVSRVRVFNPLQDRSSLGFSAL